MAQVAPMENLSLIKVVYCKRAKQVGPMENLALIKVVYCKHGKQCSSCNSLQESSYCIPTHLHSTSPDWKPAFHQKPYLKRPRLLLLIPALAGSEVTSRTALFHTDSDFIYF
ncbi:hypothetical protein AVEN_208761-1 [Araneus ventricosus]|uniref:Uncharacterized protein n=1 Tax=Araneus ventricosus TaxID=182803 RepID=A0A4Y2RD78_ARAVE|nr:hypothetical protein AVEN_208761-1 [Araneus ventricosus]